MKTTLSILISLLYANCLWAQPTAHFADSIRKAYHIPQLNYAVINAQSTLEIAALGKHAIHLPDTATLNDRFHIGSNTKAMTAFMIAKYVEKGKLKWTSKFFDFFPEWKLKSQPYYTNISLQDLLSHQAGIPPFQGENDPQIPNFKGTNAQKRKQFAQFVLTLEPFKPTPEQPFIYSNAGYTLATLMLEKVTGNTWEQLIHKIFNKELKLAVKLSWPENQKQKDTWGHSFEHDTLKPVASTIDYHLDYTEPAGDINITLKNYIKFIQLNLKGLKGEDNYLKAATYKFIHKGVKNYSIGWFNIYENNHELSVHSGTGAFTYFSIVHIDRLSHKAYIIFTNCFNNNTQQAVRLLMKKLKENYNY